MFNSIGRSSNFAQAGKSAADDMVRSFAAARRNSPDYGKLAETAATIRSNEKQAAMKAEASVAKAGIQAAGQVKSFKTKSKAEQELKGAKRKAGALATAGKMFGTAGSFAGEKRTKREVGSEDSWYDERIKGLEKSAAELRKKIENNGTTTETTGTTTPTGNTGGSKPGKVSSAAGQTSGSDGWNRLSRVIRFGEGTTGDRGYNTQFTGRQFEDLSRHPRQINSSNGYSSDAAGAYQFLSTTWDRAKNALNLPDFSVSSQEKAGRYLTEQRGVNPDAVIQTKEEFKAAMDKLAPEWASLPYSGVSPEGYGKGSSYYGQGGKSLDELWSLYNS
tara:strand:- start:7 stop:1002 length:996 start_codon:yes stop_codon:yes gene_type:complete